MVITEGGMSTLQWLEYCLFKSLVINWRCRSSQPSSQPHFINTDHTVPCAGVAFHPKNGQLFSQVHECFSMKNTELLLGRYF